MMRLSPLPDWFARPAVRALIAAFAAEDLPLRFVGGAVRDHLLGRPVTDIDAATPAAPETVLAVLKRHHIRAVPTGLAHGTVTAVGEDQSIEITTLRRDVETDGRHAVIAFTDSWKEDAARRDFTMNALYLAPDGTLHDYFGGIEDARRGVVRFIGEPSQRIAEDYLRILRFFRFLATHGQEAAEVGALAACETAALALLDLSAERIWQEMRKLLAAPDPSGALELMQATGVWQVLTGQVFDLAALTPLLALERPLRPFGVMPHPLVRLAALLRTASEPEIIASGLAVRWRLSQRDGRRLRLLAAHDTTQPLDLPRVHRLVYRHGAEEAPWLLMLDAAERRAPPAVLARLWQEAAQWPCPRLPVSGEDLKARGIPPGPAMGEALRRMETAWLESDFTLEREALLARLDG